MKEDTFQKLLFIWMYVMLGGLLIYLFAGYYKTKDNNVVPLHINSYDQNDGIYKFIPSAPEDWLKLFGDNERTRLLHSISELRVVVANQGRRILELEAKLKPKEPNEN